MEALGGKEHCVEGEEQYGNPRDVVHYPYRKSNSFAEIERQFCRQLQYTANPFCGSRFYATVQGAVQHTASQDIALRVGVLWSQLRDLNP